MSRAAQLAERLWGVTPYDLDKLAELLEHARNQRTRGSEDAGRGQ